MLRRSILLFQYQLKKNGNNKKISYRLKFLCSFRFMSTSLSNLVNNLSEIYKKVCKRCKKRKNIDSVCHFIGLRTIN